MRIGRLVGPSMLAVALVPGGAAAQPRIGLAPASFDTPAQRAGGVEVAAASTLLVFFPTVGGHVSVPAGSRARLEASLQVLPYFLEDGEDVGLISQVQMRLPFRAGPPGSRRSLLLGLTGATVGDHSESRRDWDFFSAVRPHVGVSWQWQRSEHVDMRIDLQGVFTGTAPVVLPLTTFSIVFHRDRRWQ